LRRQRIFFKTLILLILRSKINKISVKEIYSAAEGGRIFSDIPKNIFLEVPAAKS